MDNNWIKKAKIDLYKIVSNLSFLDYVIVNINPKTKKKYKKHRPYTLSNETIRVKELYTLILALEYDYIENNIKPGIEDEEKIKGYLLPIRLHQTELLK